MGKISLEGMTFFAHHGVTDEEQMIGNRYTVDVVITTDFYSAAQNDNIGDTINYEAVFQIVSGVMQVNARLLEHLALLMVEKIKSSFNAIESVRVKVSKHNPPINGICARATVELEG